MDSEDHEIAINPLLKVLAFFWVWRTHFSGMDISFVRKALRPRGYINASKLADVAILRKIANDKTNHIILIARALKRATFRVALKVRFPVNDVTWHPKAYDIVCDPSFIPEEVKEAYYREPIKWLNKMIDLYLEEGGPPASRDALEDFLVGRYSFMPYGRRSTSEDYSAFVDSETNKYKMAFMTRYYLRDPTKFEKEMVLEKFEDFGDYDVVRPVSRESYISALTHGFFQIDRDSEGFPCINKRDWFYVYMCLELDIPFAILETLHWHKNKFVYTKHIEFWQKRVGSHVHKKRSKKVEEE